jgi:hypothetical protein
VARGQGGKTASHLAVLPSIAQVGYEAPPELFNGVHLLLIWFKPLSGISRTLLLH